MHHKQLVANFVDGGCRNDIAINECRRSDLVL